jgi:hypothetical protein
MIYTPHQILSGCKIEKNKIGCACSAYGARRGVCRVLAGKSKGRRPLERPRRIWENNLKKEIQEFGCGLVDCIELAQDRDRWRALAI